MAAATASDSDVEVLALGDRSPVAPTAVFAGDDGVLATGEAAARRAVSEPDRVATQFARRLGDPTPVLFGGTSYPLTDLLGVVPHDVLARAAEERGGPPEEVALTHPASWGHRPARRRDPGGVGRSRARCDGDGGPVGSDPSGGRAGGAGSRRRDPRDRDADPGRADAGVRRRVPRRQPAVRGRAFVILLHQGVLVPRGLTG